MQMEQRTLIGMGRAFAGALIFALPMLMTMEFWQLGFYVAPYKLALLLILMLPLLTGVSWIVGFEPNRSWVDSLVDACVAIAIGAAMSALLLSIFGIISTAMPMSEVVGKVALQTFAAGLGAALARSQLGQGPTQTEDNRRNNYLVSLAIMGIGALFLGLNVAPTHEVEVLSYKMGGWRLIGLVVLTVLIMHAFVYLVSFRGAPEPIPGATFWSQFAGYTLVGYALVLTISVYLLWTFGRTNSADPGKIASAAFVLGFPSGIGAAVSRLIL